MERCKVRATRAPRALIALCRPASVPKQKTTLAVGSDTLAPSLRLQQTDAPDSEFPSLTDDNYGQPVFRTTYVEISA